MFSVDEKSQIQALDRTQPGLPIKKGRCGTMTHDYKRHGTTTLFTALDFSPPAGVIGQCMQRHRLQEWLRFLRRIEAETPKHLDVHLIADNYATHKHASVRLWLNRHKRFHMHFTPASATTILQKVARGRQALRVGTLALLWQNMADGIAFGIPESANR